MRVIHKNKVLPRQPIRHLGLSALAFAIASYSANLAAEEQADALALPEIEVTAATQVEDTLELDLQLLVPSDTADYLRSLPGANVNRNGPLTGIAQYRGSFGSRVNVMVDGVHIKSSGPNAMDPPLSHIPPLLLKSIELKRGIAPVSSGLETIGGSISVSPISNDFGETKSLESTGKVSVGYRSASEGSQLALFQGLANSHHRANLSISAEQGDDYEYPGGDVSPTEYERATYGLGYSYQRHNFVLDFTSHLNDTAEAGTPALPMDIVSIESLSNRIGLTVNLADERQLKMHILSVDGEHVMDNYGLRTPPMMNMSMGMMPMMSPMMRMNTATVEGAGFGVNFASPFEDGIFTLGLDGDSASHDATITDPTNAMWYVKNFNEAQRDRTSLFAQWDGQANDKLSLNLGLRLTRVEMDSANVGSSMAMMMPMGAAAQLVNRFNSADKQQSDTNMDMVLNTTYTLTDTLALEAGIAQKTRSPSYQERYLWLPLESTGGLADGNSYVGDVNLLPEVAHQIELGFSWDNQTAYFDPRVFYHVVSDYIQGVSTTDSAVLGASMMDPTPLQYANVDAVLYGLDAPFGCQFNSQISLDGQISYVRGERDDISDNLYRIAPLNGLLALSYQKDKWAVVGELEGYAAQDEVSATNSEKATPGYSLINLKGSYLLRHNLELMGGVENLLDNEYRQHLTGYSRVDSGEISKGERIPGQGRNVFITASLEW